MQLVFSINLLKLNNDKIISKTDIITIINIVIFAISITNIITTVTIIMVIIIFINFITNFGNSTTTQEQTLLSSIEKVILQGKCFILKLA